jgi:hypothetical protein
MNLVSRLFALVTVLLIPITAVADGWGDLGGTTKMGDYIGVSPCDEDPLSCSNPPPQDGFAVFIRKKDEKGPGHYFKSQKCRFSYDQIGPVRLTCTEGDSPIAGVTYKIAPNKDPNDCGFEYEYICITGCDKTGVPRVLYQSYWECSDE